MTKRKHKINLSSNRTAYKKISVNANSTKDIQKVTDLMVDVIRSKRQLWRKELNHWHAARYARYSPDYPRTHAMQELYNDVMLDGHLTGVTENRTLRTTNKNYIFTIDGVKNDDLTDYIKDKQWFEILLSEAHKSTYFGYSLLWVKAFEKGHIQDLELIPRDLVIPDKNALVHSVDDTQGIDYTELKDILLYAQFYDPIGLLEKAAVYTILKRHSWGSWDEFEELFGIPIRIAKIASSSEVVKNEVAGWLEEMGSSAYGVFPIGTEIDIKENSKSDSFRVFYMKIEALDKELSKLILHQTMTTENGSSKAQGNVHENTLSQLVYADEKKMLSFLNDILLPAMRNLGYGIPDNAKISIEKTTDPTAQINIDSQLLANGYRLTQNYIESTYGVEVDSIDPNAKKEGKP